MKKNIGPKIIAVVVVLVMLLPILTEAIVNSVLTTIKYEELNSVVTNTKNYDFALVYVASSEDEDVRDKKTEIKNVIQTGEYKSVSTNKTLKAYYMDFDKLDAYGKSEIFKDGSTEDTAYVFIVNGEIIKVVEGQLNKDDLRDYIEFYSANAEKIAEDLIAYKTPEDSKEFTKLSKDKNKVYMFVLGRDSCFYCNQFKIVYNTVADEYDLDNIYYIDSDSYNSTEYEKILDSGLKIPAKCSSTGEEVQLQSGFGTPLTLFTKNGKTIDCINGYTNKSSLITQLKTVDIIAEEK